jgi:hypothetical protein
VLRRVNDERAVTLRYSVKRLTRVFVPNSLAQQHEVCRERLSLRYGHFLPYLQWVWHGQIQPGRLQSRCRLLSTEGSAQKEEVSGGQVPRGYPMQEVPVGPGDISGMCLTTAIIVRAYQSSSKPVCSRMLTLTVAVE